MNKITGVYELLSPLSHIGETAGIDSYLNTQSIVVDDKVEEVFVYSGNAIRGALRDAGAMYFLGDKKINNDLFYLLFSGGSISGDQKNDISKNRETREKIPMVSVFGGGIGTTILPGKIKVSDGYVACTELNSIIPIKSKLSWREQTGERSYTRFDDSKDPNKQELMEAPPEEKKKKKEGEASTQMRYTVETLNLGAKIYSMIDLVDLTDIELGCLISCIVKMCETPYLGGKSNIGMGRFKLDYTYNDEDFISLDDMGNIELSDFASEKLKIYDDYISTINIAELSL